MISTRSATPEATPRTPPIATTGTTRSCRRSSSTPSDLVPGPAGVLLPDPRPVDEEPSGQRRRRSYRSAIFFTSEEQEHVALDTIADVDASGLWPGKVVTEVDAAGAFWQAEEEHQDYLEKYPAAIPATSCDPGGFFYAVRRSPLASRRRAAPACVRSRRDRGGRRGDGVGRIGAKSEELTCHRLVGRPGCWPAPAQGGSDRGDLGTSTGDRDDVIDGFRSFPRIAMHRSVKSGATSLPFASISVAHSSAATPRSSRSSRSRSGSASYSSECGGVHDPTATTALVISRFGGRPRRPAAAPAGSVPCPGRAAPAVCRRVGRAGRHRRDPAHQFDAVLAHVHAAAGRRRAGRWCSRPAGSTPRWSRSGSARSRCRGRPSRPRSR